MSSERQKNVLEIISAILHLGNIQFVEDNNVAEVENPSGRRFFCMLWLLSWSKSNLIWGVSDLRPVFIRNFHCDFLLLDVNQ